MEKLNLMYTPKRTTEVWGYTDDGCVEIPWNKIVHKLNFTASYIWDRCNGRVTVKEILYGLAKNTDVSDDLNKSETDVLAILESWKCEGLLIVNFNTLHSEYDASCIYHIEANVAPPVDILFLSPPSPSPYAHRDFVLDPLGLGYMSAFLKSHGYNVGVMDLWIKQLNPNTVMDFVKRYNPKIVGISAKTVNFENGVIIAEIIKKISSDIIILFGGYHVTFNDEEILYKYNCIDIIVRREGEHTVLELVNFFLHNIGELSEIDGITFRKSSKVIRTQDRALICDLNSLPFPDRVILEKNVPVGIQTSRGCPAKYIFCSARGLAGGNYRQHTAEYIVAEIESLLSQRVNYIFFKMIL